jgi:SOS-response transcriptional repressor LexA
VRLQPENASYAPIVVSGELSLEGVVAAVIRVVH